MKVTIKTEIFNKLASVINSHIVHNPSSLYHLYDNEVDMRILQQSLDENDSTLLYIVRPSGTCMLRCDRYFFPAYYVTSRGNYREFVYVHLDLRTGESRNISWEEAQEMLSKPMPLPVRNGLGKLEYLTKVVDDLRDKGYADYLPAISLDQLRKFAKEDERPSLVKYIDNVMTLM
ncbi:hypothetical protein ABWC92_000836 [Escherichia coli]